MDFGIKNTLVQILAPPPFSYESLGKITHQKMLWSSVFNEKGMDFIICNSCEVMRQMFIPRRIIFLCLIFLFFSFFPLPSFSSSPSFYSFSVSLNWGAYVKIYFISQTHHLKTEQSTKFSIFLSSSTKLILITFVSFIK